MSYLHYLLLPPNASLGPKKCLQAKCEVDVQVSTLALLAFSVFKLFERQI